jgi:hypothetical protein
VPGVVAHSFNSAFRELRQEDHKFQASLGYSRVTLSLKEEKKNKQTKDTFAYKNPLF